MLTEHTPLLPPDPAGARGRTRRPGKLDDGFLHSELVTQRNRALTYAVAGLAMLLTKVSGIFDVHFIWGVAIFGAGILSVGWFSLLARRAARENRRADLAAWWIACDIVLVTAIACATGGVASPWFVMYLGCLGAAVTHLRLRLAVTLGAGAALLYFTGLAVMYQIGLGDRTFFVAALQLLLLFGASLFLLANTRKLLASTQLNQRLKNEADARVEELTRVTRDLEAMSRLLQDFTETDQLTGLHNRRYLLDQVAAAARWRGHEHSSRRTEDRSGCAAVIMIDVDHFKIVNDTYGHAAGDAALKHVAKLLRRCVRGNDKLARWGGDEFLVLLPQVHRERIPEVVERILATVRERPSHLTVEGGDLAVKLTCSLGWTAFNWRPPQEGTSHWDGALATADQALYEAKHEGRDRACFLPTGEDLPAENEATAKPALPPENAAFAEAALPSADEALAEPLAALAAALAPAMPKMAASADIAA
ncbi:MAG TPA: GGDEF domain-containing protein [Thermoanaerobaculia bacterium]|nr:GGDEF domain-containing protein [Thermoanaerobaculia bacterium]